MKKKNNITTIIAMVLAIALPIVGYANKPSPPAGFTGDSRGAEFMRERYPAEVLDELVERCGGEQEVWRKFFRLYDASEALSVGGLVVLAVTGSGIIVGAIAKASAATISYIFTAFATSGGTYAIGVAGRITANIRTSLNFSQLSCAVESGIWSPIFNRWYQQ